ncbi:penicillin-binding transpeptidase domain-containing protein, partial [candidate division KSB1 bacterium]
PINGNNLVLTLDNELQSLAEELLAGYNGAIIALNPQNGELYATVSKPDYDPILMSGRITPEQMDVWNNDPSKPLYNRATQGTYPPGSTFKLIGAITALNEGILSPDKTYTCTGSHRVGREVKLCWNRGGHGTLNMIEAIEQSCNVYFYNLSRELEIDTWAKYAGYFEFGSRTGLDFPENQENEGVLPTTDFMKSKFKPNEWTELGTIVNLIIGQGELLTNPLQVCRFAAALCTKGRMIQPHFLKYIVDSYTDSVLYRPEYPYTQIEEINEEVWDIIREGMYRVINGEHGTARSVGWTVRDAVVGGKTGTSENPHGDDHAWFIGFAPFENPSIAITVIVENGGGGSRVAAPIASQVINKYFELQKNQATGIPIIAQR